MGQGVLTVPLAPALERLGGVLSCEAVPLPVVAERVGTPVYVYSTAAIRQRHAALTAALAGIDVHLHYAMKANSSGAILTLLRELGTGVDIVSGGELFRAVRAGFAPSDIVFSGVGKTAAELESALLYGVGSVNVESAAELALLHQMAARLGVVAPVLLRVNPDVSVDSPHPYIRTGEHGMKFGIPDDQIVDVARAARDMPHVQLRGIAAHLGSQISDATPYARAGERLLQLCDDLRALGVATIRTLDLGGGLAVESPATPPLDLERFADAVRALATRSGLRIVLEPGRFLVADAGTLVTRVLYRKHSGGKEIVVADAGMNDLIRPALYDAYHGVAPVRETHAPLVANVVGPICESGDFFAIEREIGDVHAGDLLAIDGAGAYVSVMASNYNSRPRAAEVLVDGGRFAVITRRETYDDLVRLESHTLTWSEA